MSKLREKILELRNGGMSYKAIQKELKCARSTIYYYCNSNSKTVINDYKINHRWFVLFRHKVDNFKRRKSSKYIKASNISSWSHIFRTKVSEYRKRNNMSTSKYTAKDVLNYIGGTKVTCSLTGRELDLTKDEYCLDHIVPVSKGGSNDLSNLSVVCPEANMAKNNLTNEEFIELCKEVLIHFGYTITK